MREKLLLMLMCLFSAAIGTCMVYLADRFVETGLLLAAIVLGGIGGGFTLGLIGGEQYGLKLPGKVGADHQYAPGFLGDLFVGLMSGFLGVGLASRTLKAELFPANGQIDLSAWFLNFSIAYVCGFLGLRFIKSVSEKFLHENQLKVNAKRMDSTEGVAAFLSAQEAIAIGQLDEAEALYYKSIELDKTNSARARIGLARVLRRRKHLGEAIKELNIVIDAQADELIKGRIAVAYWNRACYRAMALKDLSSPEANLIFEDLKQAIRLQPEFKDDLNNDQDLTKIKQDARFIELAS